MPDFKEIQGSLRSAKKDREQSQQLVFLSEEKLKKLIREKEALLRRNSKDSGVIEEINAKENRLRSQISEHRRKLSVSIRAEQGLLTQFQPFTDPREQIEQFSDEYPMLLFPVRLETRFKIIRSEIGLQQQLWVRIFPDECSIDTFESMLSESEVMLAQSYWSNVWSAGQSDDESLAPFIEDRKKAAWKALNNNFQPGRAYWIIENYEPVNTVPLPERSSEKEVILVVPTEELPVQAEQEALQTYWAVVWLAKGNFALIENASNELVIRVGSEARATELLSNYKPFNFQDGNSAAENPLPPQVVFLQFPKTDELDTQLSSWSQPAKVTTLPDKFVLLGYQGTDSNGQPIEVLNELGRNIPDPLIIGPNPSADTSAILSQALIDEYQGLATDLLKTEKLAEYYGNFKDKVTAETSQSDFIANFKTLPEAEVEAALKQVFDNIKDDIKAASYVEYLSQKSETKWLYDFDEAVKVGMGFKVNLSPSVYRTGFDRLFVLGVKLSADHNEAKTDLEELFQHHHFGMNGFSIMPQGTPTNNTEDQDAGYSESEEDDDTYERYVQETTEEDPDDILKKKDGKWLAEMLGIDADKASLKLAANYYQTDQCEAKTMNTALWNATIGYWMESMMTPVFSEEDEATARHFFTHFVSGRGNLPAIRIGDQPYGILSTSTVKNMKWLNPRQFPFKEYSKMLPVINSMYQLSRKVGEDWDQFSDQVAFVGKGGDPHQALLDALGLHASSVEFYQRYAESFAHLFNRLNLTGIWAGLIEDFIEGSYKTTGLNLLKSLGYTLNPEEEEEIVPILEKFFLTKANQLKGELIDDQPLSEQKPIRPYTTPLAPETEGKNYIYWLIENALADHNKIKNQQGFADGTPKALLYQMLRHALELEFSNTGFKLYQGAEILNAGQIKQAKVDADFIGIQADVNVLTKYDYLGRKEARIINEDITVGKHISNLLAENLSVSTTRQLKSIIDALEHLKDVPTARLERAFVEHLDCCTYRLDAWLLGFVNFQLYLMRYLSRGSSDQSFKPGIYLGAYAWLENLKPDQEQLTAVNLDAELKAIFDPEDNLEIVKDKFNGGYIHAPSINHATTAAVLRNAYISNANEQNAEVYKINLSSERVRMALSMIEGMQQGQSLGALLGYHLERGLHDRHQEAEVDIFIYELRTAFPLSANRSNETSTEEATSITQIEARNVVDGLALVNHINQTQNKNYPFGKTGLAAATPSQSIVINTEVERLLNINDAIADLASAEGIHQVVQNNYDRAANTLETYSKGSFPQTPEVIRTPRSGVSLTNRFGIHLQSGIVPLPGAAPRATAEPAVDLFLRELFPSMADICCQVIYSVPTYTEGGINPEQEVIVSMDDLGLGINDLFYLLDIESDKSLTALDDYILQFIHTSEIPRPDSKLKINYTTAIDGKISLFELAPLVKSLRSLILAARPLKNSDLMLPNEANSGSSDLNCTINLNRIDGAFTQFKDSFTDVNNLDLGIDLANHPFNNLFFAEEEELTLNNQLITDGIDNFFDQLANQPANFSPYTQQRAGSAAEELQNIQIAIQGRVSEYKTQWEENEATYNALIAQVAGAATDDEKLALLQQAEQTISTSLTAPLPATVAQYQTIVDAKKTAFDDKLGEVDTWLNDNFATLTALANALNILVTGVGSVTGTSLEEFDLNSIPLAEEENQLIRLAEQLNGLRTIEEIDNYSVSFIANLHTLSSHFGLPQSGFGFFYDRKASIYAAIYQQILDYKIRWEEKQATYAALIVDFGNASTDDERIDLLQQAERTISTTPTIPLPAAPNTVSDYEAIVIAKKDLFDNKLAEITAWLNGNFVRFIDLVNELNKLTTGTDSATGRALNEFDLLGIDTEKDERQIVVLGEDLHQQALALNEVLLKKAKAVEALLAQHNTEVNPIKKVNHLMEIGKLLFGEEFKVVPEFQLSAEHGGELKQTYDDTNQLLSYQTTEQAADFPVDDWLYGIARVREKMSQWENVIMLAEGFKDVALDLTPLQLPYLSNDTWLALAFSEDYEIESDKLLYTGYLPNLDPTKPQCGLFIDEWTEVIPTERETTGLTFQYDQPNTEPPQSILLATPSEFTGEWAWEDLANTLHETLDLAKLRAVEPVQIDRTAYAQFLPATTSAVTVRPLLTLALNYAVNNGLLMQTNSEGDA